MKRLTLKLHLSNHSKTSLMKTVCFIRHAKSSWAVPALVDKERPLNVRGFHDAPFMAKKLIGLIPELDGIHCSSATRNQANLPILYGGIQYC